MTGIEVGLVALGVWLFAPSPKQVFREEKSEVPIVQQAEVSYAQINFDNAWKQFNEVNTKLQKMQEQIDAQNKAKEEAQKHIISYAQESNQMAYFTLCLLPEDKKTPETEQTKMFILKTDFALSSIVGDMSDEQQTKLAQVVKGLLSSIQEERDKAQTELKEKDKLLNASIINLNVAQARLQDAQDSIKEQKQLVEEKKQEVEQTKTQYESKVQEAFAKISAANAKLGFWYKFLIVLGGIYIWFFWILPLLSERFIWLKPIVQFNKWVRNIIFRV